MRQTGSVPCVGASVHVFNPQLFGAVVWSNSTNPLELNMEGQESRITLSVWWPNGGARAVVPQSGVRDPQRYFLFYNITFTHYMGVCSLNSCQAGGP